VALDFGNLIWTKAEQEYGYPCRNADVWRYLSAVEDQLGLRYADRVGGGVTPAVLPHHRTCGSASGGS
jgi:hypothetical protein